MTHPTYNAIVRSTFEWWSKPSELDWSELHKSATLRKTSAAKVAAEREQGVNNGAIHGLSKKADLRLATSNHGGAYGRAVASIQQPARRSGSGGASNTERVRRALKRGPMTAPELSQMLGIETPMVRGLLKYDRGCGRIVVVEGSKPQRFALLESAP